MKYEPEEFSSFVPLNKFHKKSCVAISDYCNAKLQTWLDAAPVVYYELQADEICFSSHIRPEYEFKGRSTHTARLVDVKELK